MKKILKWFFIVIGVLLVLLIATPFLFKDKLVGLIKEETNKNLNATVDFSDASLSLIRSFPNLSLELENLSVINMAPFAGDTLVYAKSLGITVDIMSVIRGSEINIRSVTVADAVMNFLVTKEGKANWDIAKPSETPTAAGEPSKFKASLKSYTVSNADVTYDDRSLDFYLRLKDVNHAGKGDFTQDLFVLSTTTISPNVAMKYGGVPYIAAAKAEILADLDMDMKQFKFTFKQNQLKLNELELGVDGWVAMPDTNIDMDLKFNAPKADFRNFLSMIPAVYSKDFSSIQANGKMALSGFIKGRYNAASMPGFGLKLDIDNGRFKYPSLPAEVRSVFVNLAVENPDGVPDHTYINLSRLDANLGGDEFRSRLVLKTPVSDPDLDAMMKGRINLDNVKKFVPLEKGTDLSGRMEADLELKGRMSSIDRKQYDQFKAAGRLLLSQFKYVDPAVGKPVSIAELKLGFSPQIVRLENLQMQAGKTDIQAEGSLEQFLAYFLKDEGVLTGKLNMTSRVVDLNEWMPASDSTNAATADTAALSVIPVPANIDFTMNASIGKLVYTNFNIYNLKGSLIVRDESVRMSGVNMQLMDGTMAMNGSYSTKNPKAPDIDFSMDIKNFDMQKTVATFNTVEKLAPMAKYCSGKFGTTMTVKGQLDQHMSPVVNSLTGAGKLSTSQVVISNFPAFNKLADALKMPSWKKLDVPALNPSFRFVNGRVYVDPFDVTMNGNKATIAGSNGFDQTIDYTMAVQIPRSSFGGNANAALEGLVSKANASGANFSLGETVPLNVTIGGTVLEPKVGTDLNKKGAAVMDDLKAKAKAEFDKKKAEAEAKARAEADKLKAEAEAKLNAEKEKAKAEADRLKKEAEAKAKAAADSAKKAAEKKGKEMIDEFNPFKKKK
ncbi:MAG TPA: AsmA-like C-terminal region-containing protein [Bacteroidia bacterium]|nr:AsmA-like C-terminal region-containing protein [Bacteroidia bacterium]